MNIDNHLHILVYTPSKAEEYAQYLQENGFANARAASTPEQAAELIDHAEVLYCWKFPLDLLQRANRLCWIQSMGAGVDDLARPCAVPDNLVITRVVGEFSVPMAEHVFTYLLYFLKRADRIREQQQQHLWKPFLADNLAGKVLGVAGLGSIGQEIVRKARAFDLHIRGLSLSGRHSDIVDEHFGPHEWLPFTKDLDALVLTMPLTEQTYHSVNGEVLHNLPDGAIVVNVGRGKLIDEISLVQELVSGRLKAILDVFETEPLPIDHPLWSLQNVIVTPHLSGPSTIHSAGRFFVENLRRYISGEPLVGLVNREVGY